MNWKTGRTARHAVLAFLLILILILSGCGKKNSAVNGMKDGAEDRSSLSAAETLDEAQDGDDEGIDGEKDSTDPENSRKDGEKNDAADSLDDANANASSEDSSSVKETTKAADRETKKPENTAKETTAKETTKAAEATKAQETTKAAETTKAPESTKAPETTQAAGGSVTISIVCHTILNNPGFVKNPGLWEFAGNGTILPPTTVTIEENDTVFDVLHKACKQHSPQIHLEYSYTPLYGSYYIEGINNIYEKDAGDESGWMYRVNGWYPNYGCSSYTVEDGDVIEWIYTCELGRDIGGGF